MPPALYIHQKQFSQSHHRGYIDSRRSSSSSSQQEQQMALPSNEHTIDSEGSRVGSIGRQPSESVAATQGIPDMHRESLESLRRRSMPHVPTRSSSLTLPPATPQDNSPRSNLEEAAPARSRGWLSWLRGLFTSQSSSPAPIPTVGITVHRRTSRSISESFDGTSISTGEPLSSRYNTLLSSLWIWRRLPTWRPAVHPLVYGFRFFHRRDDPKHTPLDVGCEVLGGPSTFGIRAAKSLPHLGELHEDATIDDEDADPPDYRFRSDYDNSHSFSHIEYAEPVLDAGTSLQGRRVGNTVYEYYEDAEPTSSDHRFGFESVGNPPPSPRPAHRNLPSASDTPPNCQRAIESRAQEFTEVSLLLDFRIERRFSNSVNTAPTISISGASENGGNGSTTPSDGTVTVVAVSGEGNPTISGEIGSPVQDNLAAAVQNFAANIAQNQSDPLGRLIISIEEASKTTSAPEAGETIRSSTELEDVDVDSALEDFAPLERVMSHSHSPPCA